MIIFNCLSFIQSLECLKVLTMSSWNPPPGNRKMHGDLMYLNVVTMEDRHFSITASTRGFYVNQWVTMYSCPSKCPCPTRKTNTYNLFSFHFFFLLRSMTYSFNPKPANPSVLSHALLDLLGHISPVFKKNFSALLKRRYDSFQNKWKEYNKLC